MVGVDESRQHHMAAGVKIVVARELTKLHEEFLSGTAESILELFSTKKPKGEMVVLVEGCPEAPNGEMERQPEQLLQALLDELPIKVAAKLAARQTGLNKRALYDRALKLKENKISS